MNHYFVRAIKKVFSEEEMRGLGDVVAKATKAVGIQPCEGCKKRQEALNKLVSFKIDRNPK